MTLYILKLLYPGCSTKEVRTLPLFAEHLKFQEKTNSQKNLGEQRKIEIGRVELISNITAYFAEYVKLQE